MASNEISVTVETSIHQRLRDLAQEIFEAHGVQLKVVTVDWFDIGTVGAPRSMVAAVTMETKKLS